MKEKPDKPEKLPVGSLLRMAQDGIAADPFGSYTGVAEGLFEIPVQDADDL